ncbi:hypothetical protein X975_20530, partial [Stegodyphus mimosarum]
MSSSVIFVTVICLASCLTVYSQGGGGMSRPSWLMPNEQEKQICEDNANGRTVVEVKKDRPLSCHVMCYYDDGSDEMYNSPDNQLCCDMGGVMPTGMCKDGKCPMGGLFG